MAMGDVVQFREPFRIDGKVVDGDAKEAMLRMLERLADCIRTVTASGYRTVRIEFTVQGIERPRPKRRKATPPPARPRPPPGRSSRR